MDLFVSAISRAEQPSYPYSTSSKFLEVLLHQMPRKLQQALADILLPKKYKITNSSRKSNQKERAKETELEPLEKFWQETRACQNFSEPVINNREEWRWQWLESCAAQAQYSLESCWQLLKDFGLSSYVKYSYFDSCYRNAKITLERELRGELRIILQYQSEYPNTLLDLRQPPRLLFWQGQLLSKTGAETGVEATTIIGSRRADSWGLQQAWQEALLLQKQCVEMQGAKIKELLPSKQAHWIISGLARGCDFAAHRGALEAGGQTLAVLPGGFDRIYPKQHKHLAQKIIAEGGALVSEYVPPAAPLKWRFIQRDRLQAALARRLLLIQSDLSSGSMHAVQVALEINRPIYVLTGDELCWQLQSPQEDAQQNFCGNLQFSPSQRQFRRDTTIMNTNYFLLEQNLARPWYEYTQSLKTQT